jgi:hypothetical protein
VGNFSGSRICVRVPCPLATRVRLGLRPGVSSLFTSKAVTGDEVNAAVDAVSADLARPALTRWRRGGRST